MQYNDLDEPKAKLLPGHPLFDIVSEAYRIFAYPKPTSIGVCEKCCMSPAIEADFFNPPIERLPLGYLQDWYLAAYDKNAMPKATWGYLLPRVLEVLAYGEEVSILAPELSLNRFFTGDPSKWRHDEWEILTAFQQTYLAKCLHEGDLCIDDALCMFSLAGWAQSDLFAQLETAATSVLVECFWSDWCDWVAPGREAVWITSFWEEPDASTALHFYTSEKMRTRIYSFATSPNTSPEAAEKAHKVLAVIETSVRD